MSSQTTPLPAVTDPVRRAVTLATRLLRQRRALRFGASGLLAGSLLGCAVAVAISTNLLRETTLPGGGAFLFLPSLAGLLAGCFHGAAGKYDPTSVARLLERRLGLQERLSTALTARDDSSLSEAQREDADAHAPDEARVRDTIPLLPVPRRAYAALAVTAAVALTYFAPTLPVFWSTTRRAEQGMVQKEGNRLLAIAKAAGDEARKQNLPEAEKAAKKVEKLGKEMATGRMPLRQALMERAKLAEELRKAQDKITRERGDHDDKEIRKDLSATGRSLQKNFQQNGTTPAPDAAKDSPDTHMKAIQDALAQGDKSGVARELRAMADAAERGEPAPGAQRSKTGGQLSALGDALNRNNLPDAGKSAAWAGDAMRKDAMPDAARSLREAADKIEQHTPTPPSPTSPPKGSDASPKPTGEQNALQKMVGQVQKATGAPSAGTPGASQNSGQGSQSGTPPRQTGGQPQPGDQSGQPGKPGSQPGKASEAAGGEKGQEKQGSQGAVGQESHPGQGPTQAGKAGPQSGKSGGKAGTGAGEGNKPGASQGQSGARKSGGSKGGNGIGSGSSGAARTGESAQRLGKGAREQNVHGKQSGTGPETVITENDNDHSALPVASLPYYKEFVKKQKGPAGESAQTREAVPNAYRDQVRGYFDSAPPAPKSGEKVP